MLPIAKHRWLAILLLGAWCGFLFFYGLNAGELYRTEGLRAVVAAECLRDGNWLVPTLYGQPLLTKPPGMYAAIALCSWPLGEVTQGSARLPSALAATVAVLLFAWYFARQLGRGAGLLAGTLLPTSVFWLDKAPSAEIDMLQLAWVTVALLLVLQALEERASCGWWYASLLCVAGGVLTKWTAPVFFYATLIPLLAWRRQLRVLLGWPHLGSAAVAGLLCLGWVAWAALQTERDLFWATVCREALQHLSPGHHQDTVRQLGEHHHRRLNYAGQALLLPFTMFAMTLPWSILALLALRPSFYRRLGASGQRLLQAFHCWTWPNLLLWSWLPDPSPRHAAPLIPGIMGLAVVVVVHCCWGSDASLPRWQRFGKASLPKILLGFLIVWIGAKLVFVHYVMPSRAEKRAARTKGEQIATQVPANQQLYLFRLKDEGILFYYGRPVRRLESPAQLPSSPEPVYCMLTETEWQQWPSSRPAQAVLRLQDQQGAVMVLAKVVP